MLAVVALAVQGCRTDPPVDPGPAITQDEAPAYADLVTQYNANLAGLDSFIAYAQITLEWVEYDEDAGADADTEPRDRREFGDGRLIYDGPDRVAVLIEKLGKTLLWAGTDGDRYWFLDLAQNRNVAHVGRLDDDDPGDGPGPLAVNASLFPYLLGLLPLDPAATTPAGEPPAVFVDGDRYRVEPPGLPMTLWLDPATARPARVVVYDDRAWPVVESRLDGAVAMPRNRVDPSYWPDLPQTAVVRPTDRAGVPDERHAFTLVVSSVDEPGPASRVRIQDAWFDFDTLVRTFGAEVREVSSR